MLSTRHPQAARTMEQHMTDPDPDHARTMRDQAKADAKAADRPKETT